jgi:hypothetical protein
MPHRGRKHRQVRSVTSRLSPSASIWQPPKAEAGVGERQVRRVAVPEVRRHAGLPGVVGGDLHHGPADVQPGHPVTAPGQFHREVARAGRHLEDRGARGQVPGEPLGLPAVLAQLALGAALPGVPAGGSSFHLRHPETL